MLFVLAVHLAAGLLVGHGCRAPHLATSSHLLRGGAPRCVDSTIERLEVDADPLGAPGADTFAGIGLAASGVAENLAAANVSSPNALQRASFAPIASGRDAILHAHTGSGKTLAFLLALVWWLQKEPEKNAYCCGFAVAK